MAALQTSTAILQEAVNALATYYTQVAAANALMVSRSTLQSRLREASRRGVKPKGVVDQRDPQVMASTIKRLEVELKAHQKVTEQSEIIKGVIGTMARKVEELDPPAWIVKRRPGHGSPGVPTLLDRKSVV